jgi:hypothetical protein
MVINMNKSLTPAHGHTEKITPYEVIDNYLPRKQFEAIRDMMIKNKDFPWFYSPDVTYTGIEIDETMYFTHIFYNNHTANSQYLEKLDALLRAIQPKALLRIKGNLYPNIGEKKSNEPHKDYEFDHKGAIYYINTNNAPTILEDGTEIEAVENRILFFNPSKMHNSTFCTDQKVRVNININYF